MPVIDTWWKRVFVGLLWCSHHFLLSCVSINYILFFLPNNKLWDKAMVNIYSLCISNNMEQKMPIFLTILGAFLWNSFCTVHDHCKKSQMFKSFIKAVLCYLLFFFLPWDCDEIITAACVSVIWRLTVRCKLETKRCTLSIKMMCLKSSVTKVGYLWLLTLLVQPRKQRTRVWCTKPKLLVCLVIWKF